MFETERQTSDTRFFCTRATLHSQIVCVRQNEKYKRLYLNFVGQDPYVLKGETQGVFDLRWHSENLGVFSDLMNELVEPADAVMVVGPRMDLAMVVSACIFAQRDVTAVCLDDYEGYEFERERERETSAWYILILIRTVRAIEQLCTEIPKSELVRGDAWRDDFPWREIVQVNVRENEQELFCVKNRRRMRKFPFANHPLATPKQTTFPIPRAEEDLLPRIPPRARAM